MNKKNKTLYAKSGFGKYERINAVKWLERKKQLTKIGNRVAQCRLMAKKGYKGRFIFSRR